MRRFNRTLLSPLAIAAFLVATAGGCTLNDRSADWTNKLKQAEQEENNKNFSVATKLYEEALSDAEELGVTDVRLPQSLNILSEEYLKRGEQEKCLGLFRRAWQICDDHFPPLKGSSNRPSEDDRRWAKEAFIACSGLVKVYSDLGQAGATKDFYDRAVQYDKIVGDPELTLQLRRTYESAEKRLSEMETSFDQAIRQGNKNSHVKEDSQVLTAQLTEWTKNSVTAPYPVAEAALMKIVNNGRLALGIRNADYRLMIDIVFWFYVKNHQYNKARAFVEDDAKSFASFEQGGTGGADVSPEDTQEACRLAQDLDMLGQIANNENDREQAIKLYLRALAVYNRYRVNSQPVAETRCRLAAVYLAVGGHETEAEQEMRAAVALTNGKTPLEWRLQYLTALSEMRRVSNDFGGAVSALEEELQLAAKNKRLDCYFRTSMGLANLYQQHNMLNKAAEVLEESLKREEMAGNQANYTRMTDDLLVLAQVYQGNGQPAKAREDVLRVLTLLPKLSPEDSLQRYTRAYSLLGACEGELGNPTAEEKYFREGLAHAEKLDDKQSAAQFLIWLGNFLTGGGVTDEGSRCYDRALQLVQGHTDKDWSHLAVITYRMCGVNSCGRGDLKVGIEQLQKANSIAKQEAEDKKITLALIDEDIYYSSIYLAFALALEGRLKESQTYFDATQELIDSKKILDSRWLYDYYWRRAVTYYLQGKTANASELRQKAAKVNTKKTPEFLDELRSHIRQTASYFGAPPPDVSPKGIFPSALDVLKARDRKFGHNTYFSAFGYLWLSWGFDDAGLAKEGDHLQSIADSILKDLKPIQR